MTERLHTTGARPTTGRPARGALAAGLGSLLLLLGACTVYETDRHYYPKRSVHGDHRHSDWGRGRGDHDRRDHDRRDWRR